MNNIEVFNDTQMKIKNNTALRKLTEQAISNTYIINEGFSSYKSPAFKSSHIRFEENLTLRAASRMVDAGRKTAILNFANSIEPGGGVLRGANAQEEYICRATNLFDCLISEKAAEYYRFHNKIIENNQFNSMFLATDKLIYSPGIIIIKEDINFVPDCVCNPIQEYTDNWREVDVITCAAPYFNSTKYILPNGDLHYLLCNRIRNILEASIDNDIEALILGAFGCGAFHNPPMVVAQAFQTILLEPRYKNAFSDVVLAVKRTADFCENIEAFDITFKQFPPMGKYVFSTESNKRRFFE